MAESTRDQSKIASAIHNLTLVIFALQITLIGLVDGSSFWAILIGLVLGIAGVIHPLQRDS